MWHDHFGDPKLKDPEDEYDHFLKEQGLRVEMDLLSRRHALFTDLKNEVFDSAVRRTKDLLHQDQAVIYGGALQSEKLGLRARPDVIKINKGTCLIEEYKLASTLDETHKIQALVYAYLLKKGYGIENECKVVSRLNEEFVIPYNEQEIEEAIQCARDILARDKPPYPIYNCPSVWGSLQNKTAKGLQDITLAWHVGPVHARKLHQMSVHTLEDLAKLGPESLKTIKGLGPKKIPQIVNSTQAQLSNRVIKVGRWKPIRDPSETEIFIDLEGTTELFQDDPVWNCIYLIGLIPRRNGQERPYISYLAKKPEDEKAILSEFVDYLRKQESRYRLYHWHHYEKMQLKKACGRHDLDRRLDHPGRGLEEVRLNESSLVVSLFRPRIGMIDMQNGNTCRRQMSDEQHLGVRTHHANVLQLPPGEPVGAVAKILVRPLDAQETHGRIRLRPTDEKPAFSATDLDLEGAGAVEPGHRIDPCLILRRFDNHFLHRHSHAIAHPSS
ncbi:MAG: ribonuclease H-like domain-containing protein [Planctomycetes bacterium]|nr:ribonuclease H-like domain-containing protein [Planctomycetota bacterium]